MKKEYFFLIMILATFSKFSYSSEDRYTTGTIRTISKNSIELSLATGMISHIGFSCEPKVCNSTGNFVVGDKVLLTLGAVEGENKLLSIRKCLEKDKHCKQAIKIEKLEDIESERISQRMAKEHKECQGMMEKDLVKDKRYIFKTNPDVENGDEIIQNYNSHAKKPSNKFCLENVVNSHQKALLESCLRHDCGKDIGGGCYHIVGYSITNTVLSTAIERCAN